MLQFGGHHLALNITMVGLDGILTPSLTAAQPAKYTVDGKTVECFRLPLDYRDWPRCRPHRPRAERMMEMVEVTPSAMSVQTQKKTPLELAILPPTSPAPLMWITRTPNPPIDPRSMITYPVAVPRAPVFRTARRPG